MRLALVCALSLGGTLPLRALDTVINLTRTTIDGHAASSTTLPNGGATVEGGFIQGDAASGPGVLFRLPKDSTESNGGSGTFRDLFRVGDTKVTVDPFDAQEGYNRDKAIEASVPNGFDPYIKISDLPMTTDGSTAYYIFAFDANENTGGTDEYISIDDVRLYVQTSGTYPSDPGTMPTSVGEMETLASGSTWDNVWRMSPDNDDTTENATTQSYVLLDYSLFSGSGNTADMFMFVPVSYFSGYNASAYVYLYAAMGLYSARDTVNRTAGFDPSDGDEQWATLSNVQFDPYWVAPEPSTVWGGIGCGLLALAGLARLLRRRRGALQAPAIG